MKIFWSWQSDLDPLRHRHFIKSALEAAIAQASQELDIEDADRPKLDHDTKGMPGMVDIPATILNKIATATLFVADITPIGKADNGKALPNPNVMIELGWAFQKPGYDRIIAVYNSAEGWKPEELPFDIRHRRPMSYNLPTSSDKSAREKAKAKLVLELAEAVKTNIKDARETSAVATEIVGVAANPSDRSIWASFKNPFTHTNAFGGAGKTEVTLLNLPRAFVRIIPSGWRNVVPSVSDISSLPQDLKLRPPFEGSASGDFGLCREGFIEYVFASSDGPREAKNLVCFFDETGEFWCLHASAIVRHRDKLGLKQERVLANWNLTIRNAMRVLDQFEALPTRRVELGLVGMEDVHWPGQWSDDSPMSRKADYFLAHQSADWSDTATLNFLVKAYTGMKDLFGLPRATSKEVDAIISKYR
jgi:hypothetical protein